jgi:hypothetical protein
MNTVVGEVIILALAAMMMFAIAATRRPCRASSRRSPAGREHHRAAYATQHPISTTRVPPTPRVCGRHSCTTASLFNALT